jgi:isoleucyl-tRNA synthetase
MISLETFSSTMSADSKFWERLLSIREAVNKIIQESRDEKIIGNSLDAEIDLYVDYENLFILNRLQDELRYFFIVSRADIHPQERRPENAKNTKIPGLWVSVLVSPHEKCVRCYHRQKDVNLDRKYPGICYRCIDNSFGAGEIRRYV